MIRHKRGDTLAWDAVWWADADKTTPFDLTGWTVTARARHESGVAVDLTVTVSDPAAGVFSIGLDAATSVTLPPGRWAFDIQRADGNGIVRSTNTVPLEIVEDVTP